MPHWQRRRELVNEHEDAQDQRPPEWSSPAGLARVPLQDVLNLGPEGRMNQPGRAGGNWRWRCTEEMLAAPALHALGQLTKAADRLASATSEGAP